MAKRSSKRSRSSRKALPLILLVLLLLAITAGVMVLRGSLFVPGASAPTPEPTPVPTPEPTPTPTPEPTPDPYAHTAVIVNEAAAVNLAMIADNDSQFPDWLELYNSGETLDLGGWTLSDKESDLSRWTIPQGTVLSGGGYLLIYASGKDRTDGELHTNFSLSANESVYLSSPDGVCRSTLSLSGLSKGEVAAVTDKGVSVTRFATPGYPNTDEGYTAMQEAQRRSSPLLIYEAVTSNANSFFHAPAGYCDWVEVRNMSDVPVQLGDYSLSDDEDEPDMWRLPQRTLMPGEIAIYICSGDESLTAFQFVHTNFKLDGQAESLFLYKNGELCDYVYLHDIPNEGSMGRRNGSNGFWFLTKSSPYAENGHGYRCYAPTPVALTKDGVFNDVDSVTVELQGDAPIYYTTDGSIPTTESTLYTGPFQVSKTCVIRAACVVEGKLTARPLTLSYILNEYHTLPVVSMAAPPGAVLGGGVYDAPYDYNGMERQAAGSIALYEDDDCFTADCGIRMYGHTGLKLAKKSFKILFRSRFGEESLHYDLFDSPVQDFTSFVLRSGQDYPFAIIRDEYFTRLCREFTDKVYTQQSKYCVLYINGQYWGIYALKEAFSTDYYASHAAVSEESVTMMRAPVALISSFYKEVIQYCNTHDMTQPENYDYFCSVVDIDSLVDWAIIEGYSGNSDVQQNLRYFRSTENGNLWQYSFYDLDWAMYYDGNNLTKVLAGIGEDGSELQHTTYIRSLLRNQTFKDKFCRRLADALATTLSDEHVLSELDRIVAEIAPEVPREREKWGGSVAGWEAKVEEMRRFIRNDWRIKIINGACTYFNLTPEERLTYFSTVDGNAPYVAPAPAEEPTAEPLE